MDEQQSRTYPIREDMRFQRRTWMLERVAWIMLGLLICAALAGAFANGPISKAKASNGELSVEYQRFQRLTRLFDFAVRIGGAAVPVLKLNRAFQETYEIVSIEPQPERSAGGPDGIELTFARSGSGELAVVIWAHPRRWGSIALQVQAGGSAPLQLPILVYP
jgi:hypothetical protein